MIPDTADTALSGLLSHLQSVGYRFVTPTPETHRRVTGRDPAAAARDLRGIFGWTLPFAQDLLPSALFDRLLAAGFLDGEAGLCRSRVRVSSLGDRLFVHSAYPTTAPDAVFFGPDSYRFARFLEAEIAPDAPVRRLVDIGTGAGVGAIVAAALVPGARLTLTDINPLALRFARINTRHAGVEVELVEGSGVGGIEGGFDLAIANPPFIVDPAQRAYRDGGAMHGGALSLEWALAAARKLRPGGRILLYTGSAIVDGVDRLEASLRESLPAGCSLRCAEIDPDIFGEELDKAGYRDVERIAAIGAVITKAVDPGAGTG